MEVLQRRSHDDFKYGIKNALSKLEKTLTPELNNSRGATMLEFFASRRYWRKHGGRMTEYSVHFHEWLQKLADDDVPVTALNPVLGWWFLLMAGLNNDGKERVVAALANDGYQLNNVRRVCCRLFAEVHIAERSSDRDRAPFRPGDCGGDRDSLWASERQGAGRLLAFRAGPLM